MTPLADSRLFPMSQSIRSPFWLHAAAFVALMLGQALSAAPLHELAAARGLAFGTAVSARALANDTTYREVLAREFSMITAENELKWAATRPAEGRFEFAAADRIVDFATTHKMQLRGHTLCWNADRYLPKWMLAREFTRAQVETLLREHIRTVVGRYRGRIKYWDVVNEAVANDNRPGAAPLFDGFWSKHLGEDYRAVVAAAVDSRACDAIVTWGFTDKFIQPGLNRRKNLPENTPTLLWLFDENYRPKPAYFAVANALQSAP